MAQTSQTEALFHSETSTSSAMPPFPCPDFSQPYPSWLLPPPPPGTPAPRWPRNLPQNPNFLCSWSFPSVGHQSTGAPNQYSNFPPLNTDIHSIQHNYPRSSHGYSTSHGFQYSHDYCAPQGSAIEDWNTSTTDPKWNEETVDELEDGGEWVLSDEWAERFALSELKREERRRQRHNRVEARSVPAGRGSSQVVVGGNSSSAGVAHVAVGQKETQQQQQQKQDCRTAVPASDCENFYGSEGAARIAGLEAALNSKFDALCDTFSPKCWPCEPMNPHLVVYY